MKQKIEIINIKYSDVPFKKNEKKKSVFSKNFKVLHSYDCYQFQ